MRAFSGRKTHAKYQFDGFGGFLDFGRFYTILAGFGRK